MSEQPIQFPPLINLTQLSKLTGINYDRLYMVIKGKTKLGFDANERKQLREAINQGRNQAIAYLTTTDD